ncbi:MAG: hypothetical protein WCI52_02105 [bacterium]
MKKVVSIFILTSIIFSFGLGIASNTEAATVKGISKTKVVSTKKVAKKAVKKKATKKKIVLRKEPILSAPLLRPDPSFRNHATSTATSTS